MSSRIALRVAARYLRKGMEFSSPEALKEYLHEHPNADRSKHRVKKPESESKGPEEKPEKSDDSGSGKGKPPIKNLVQNTKRLSDTVTKMRGQLQKLKKTFDKATWSKHEPERAKQVAEKINNAYSHAFGAAETTLTHAQSAINLARKHGGDEGDIDRMEAMRDDLEKAVKQVKDSDYHKPIKGEFAEAFAIDAKIDSISELDSAMTAVENAISLLGG
jgi:hypothetical protein